MQERKPCSGCGRDRKNHIDQNGDVAADRFGFAADALVRPVAIAPVRTGHVFGDGGRAVRSQAAAVAGERACRGGKSRLLSW